MIFLLMILHNNTNNNVGYSHGSNLVCVEFVSYLFEGDYVALLSRPLPAYLLGLRDKFGF